MTARSDTEVYRREDIVEHDEYGKVKILDLAEKVTGVSSDGVEREVAVKFTTDDLASAFLEHKIHSELLDEFLEAVEG